jgi:hypothetical protein
MTNRAGSRAGSVNQVNVPKDPDPHQNVTDPEHCLKPNNLISVVEMEKLQNVTVLSGMIYFKPGTDLLKHSGSSRIHSLK